MSISRYYEPSEFAPFLEPLLDSVCALLSLHRNNTALYYQTQPNDGLIITFVHRLIKMANPLRAEVVKLYKNLLFLGREYPKGESYFKERLKKAFMKNKDVNDPEKIRELITRGEFVIKEIEALYYLRKYRAMKQRYYADNQNAEQSKSDTH
ncbi:electron transfer flavoprotein regulatory factor 1 isoform X1 [Bombina bombina]|uniref:electron transfer flavoprotein regulatory factor 1 isoform X1 n=2 Tax=Bombina bombina TaxID=8345 RepID=UPI00235AA6A5|nr:electron transfer flavoprotein regulatory factor 1 isoform X1 [Bombina bombina]